MAEGRLSTILQNLRRRDNIRDFIDGLHDSECWPYPDGSTYSSAAIETCYCCDEPLMVEATLREDRFEELTHLYITNVYRYHPLAALDKRRQDQADLVDVSIELCPEEGSGAYSVSYQVIEKTERMATIKLNLHDIAAIRSAFIHRHEWVLNKLHSVNHDRLEACKELEEGIEPGTESDIVSQSENGEPPSEEEDHGFLLDEDVNCEPGDESEEDEEALMAEPELVVVRPYVKTTSDSSLPSFKDESDVVLGCDSSYGPSAESQFRNWLQDELSLERIHTSILADRNGVEPSPSRKRARERSVELGE